MNLFRTLFIALLMLGGSLYSDRLQVHPQNMRLIRSIMHSQKLLPVSDSASIREKLSKEIASSLIVNTDSLLVIAQRTEDGDSAEFAGQIYEIGASLNESVANTLQLSSDAKKELDMQLLTSYPDIAAEVRKEYLAKIKTLPPGKESYTTSFMYATRAEVLSSVLNSTTCSFATLVFIPLQVNVSIGANIAAGIFLQDPCEALLKYPMAKLGKQLESSGLIKDLETTCINLQLQKKSFLADISTAEMVFRISCEHKVMRSIGYGKWNKSWEGGKLSIDYSVSIAYGYDLSEDFTIRHDDQRHTITIYLPEPRMISLSMEPLATSLDDSGFPDIPNEIFTELYEKAKAEAVQSAEKNGIQAMAKQQIEVIITNLFSPFTANTNANYKIQFESHPSPQSY